MKQLKKHLKDKEFENVYLFYGEENYLKNFYHKKIEETLELGDMSMMNYDTFVGKETMSKDILNAISTLPVFSEYRLVVVKESGLFTSGRKNETDELAENFSELSSTTILIFIENDVDKRNKLYKKVNKEGCAIDFKGLGEADLVKWVEKKLKNHNIDIDRAVTLKFLKTVNRNMDTIEVELNKLISYVGEDNRRLTINDIDNVCSKSMELKIFDLVEAIGKKNPVVALDIYNNMIMMKESPLMVLTMISRQLKILLQCKYLKESGFNQQNIAKELGLPNFVIKDCLIQSNNFNKLELYTSIEKCLNIDVDIKVGKVNDKIGVEMLILEYSC